MQYTLRQLQNRKTLAQGQTDDLKVETPKRRVWLSRCTVNDGMPYNNQVTVEKYIKGRWVTMSQYQAI